MQRPAVTPREVIATSLPGVIVGAAVVVSLRDGAGQWFWAGLAVLTVGVVAFHTSGRRDAGAHLRTAWACLVGAAAAAGVAAGGTSVWLPWALAVVGLLTGIVVVAVDRLERLPEVVAVMVAVVFGVVMLDGGIEALSAARAPAGVALIGLGAAVMVAAVAGIVGRDGPLAVALIGVGAAVMGGTVAGLIGGDTVVFVAVSAVTVSVFVTMAVDGALTLADSVTVLAYTACAVVAGGSGVSLVLAGGVLSAVPLVMCGAVLIVFGTGWIIDSRRLVTNDASSGLG